MSDGQRGRGFNLESVALSMRGRIGKTIYPGCDPGHSIKHVCNLRKWSLEQSII